MATPGWTSLENGGRRLFGEIEEMSLEEVLCQIRAKASNANGQHSITGNACQPVHQAVGGDAAQAAQSPVKQHQASTAGLRLPAFLVPELQLVVASHFHATRSPELIVGGSRPLSLVYFLVAILIATHNYAVVVVDVEARFDVQRLLGMRPVVHGGVPMSAVCEADLQHVHVFRADPRWRAPLRELVAAAEERALYGMQRRRDRPLWGTIAVGGTAAGTGAPATSSTSSTSSSEPGRFPVPDGARSGATLVTGFYGWLRVDALKPCVDNETGVQSMREQRLAALFTGSEDKGPEDKRGETLVADDGNSDAENLAWKASSAWGSFTFGLFGRPEDD